MMKLLEMLRFDRAENSIMQTITIAVSAILIAAGLVTAPGLINNARDNNAKTDVANIAYAEEYAMADGGKYLEGPLPTDANGLFSFFQDNGYGIKYTLSGKVINQAVLVCPDGQEYLIRASVENSGGAIGNTFYRSSLSAKITDTLDANFSVPACIAADADFADFIEDGLPADGSPVFVTPVLTAGHVNDPYTYGFVAVSTDSVTYTSTPLPTGMTLDSGTGEFSGTPTVAGVYSFTVTATNSSGSASVVVEFIAGSDPVFSVTAPTVLPVATVGGNYSHQFEADGTPEPTFSAPSVPAGLVLEDDGLLHGIPSAPVINEVIEVTAENEVGSVTEDFTITIDPAGSAPVFSDPATPATGTVGASFSRSFPTTGTGPITYSTSTSLPAGITLNAGTGVLSGVPTATFSGNVTITATNSFGPTSQTIAVTINPFVPTVYYSNNFSSSSAPQVGTAGMAVFQYDNSGAWAPMVFTGGYGPAQGSLDGSNSNAMYNYIPNNGSQGVRINLPNLPAGTYTVTADINSALPSYSNWGITDPNGVLTNTGVYNGGGPKNLSITFTTAGGANQYITYKPVSGATNNAWYMDRIVVTRTA